MITLLKDRDTSQILIRYQLDNKVTVCVPDISTIFPIELMVEYTPLTSLPNEVLPPN